MQRSINNFIAPDKLDQLARENGFLQRRSKFKPGEFIDTMMFSWFDHSQLSLQECCNDLAQQHHKQLSKVGLHKRFNQKSLKFLKAALAEQMRLKMNIGPTDNWGPFSRVLIADSCKFALPECYKDAYPGFGGSRSKSLLGIQYAFDLKNGNWENFEFVKGTKSDTGYSNSTLERIKSGDLCIRDLGYITHDYLKKVADEKAFFLNRLHPKWKVVQSDTGKIIDWKALYDRMTAGKIPYSEITVTIGRDEKASNCRLITVIVPEKVWSERIRKAQERAKTHGAALSEEYKLRCRFSTYITNVESKILKAEDVIQLYRLRWQIELVFKSWKSLVVIHKIKAVKQYRFECQLIAKFIWVLLNWKIFRYIENYIQKHSPNHACSWWKFLKQARQHSHALRIVIRSRSCILLWCEIFIFPILKHLLIEPQKGKTAGYLTVSQIFNPLS